MNDYARTGFELNVQHASDHKLDPVAALHCYLDRTVHLRSLPVFLTLTQPFRALQSAGVVAVLKEAIKLAKLQDRGYPENCFRPTGATRGIEVGLDRNIVCSLSHWRSEQVFEEHYVHTSPPTDYTDRLLS